MPIVFPLSKRRQLTGLHRSFVQLCSLAHCINDPWWREALHMHYFNCRTVWIQMRSMIALSSKFDSIKPTFHTQDGAFASSLHIHNSFNSEKMESVEKCLMSSTHTNSLIILGCVPMVTHKKCVFLDRRLLTLIM